MAQKPGQTGNPNGRPKGSPNKTTMELRQFVQNLLQDNQNQIVKDLKKVKPEQRLAIYEKMLQYVVPKQQSIDIKAQIEAEYNELERLLKNAPEEAIAKITEKIEQFRQINKKDENEQD